MNDIACRLQLSAPATKTRLLRARRAVIAEASAPNSHMRSARSNLEKTTVVSLHRLRSQFSALLLIPTDLNGKITMSGGPATEANLA